MVRHTTAVLDRSGHGTGWRIRDQSGHQSGQELF